MQYFDYCRGPIENNENLRKTLEVCIRKFNLIPKFTLFEVEEAQLFFYLSLSLYICKVSNCRTF